jgi:hypothetical protein
LDSSKFQVNLGQFPQNFAVVTTGTGSKVKVLHGLFSVNLDPEMDAGLSVTQGSPFQDLLGYSGPPTLDSLSEARRS